MLYIWLAYVCPTNTQNPSAPKLKSVYIEITYIQCTRRRLKSSGSLAQKISRCTITQARDVPFEAAKRTHTRRIANNSEKRTRSLRIRCACLCAPARAASANANANAETVCMRTRLSEYIHINVHSSIVDFPIVLLPWKAERKPPYPERAAPPPAAQRACGTLLLLLLLVVVPFLLRCFACCSCCCCCRWRDEDCGRGSWWRYVCNAAVPFGFGWVIWGRAAWNETLMVPRHCCERNGLTFHVCVFVCVCVHVAEIERSTHARGLREVRERDVCRRACAC